METNLKYAFDIMWMGMAGIFAVIIFITIIVVLAQKLELFLENRLKKDKD